MNEDIRKRKAELLFYSITPENVEQIYKRNFTKFLFEYSDEVEINGVVYGNSPEDRMMRIKMLFNDKNGNPNIKTCSGCNTKGGFPLTELDFINNQLDNLKDLSFSDLVQRKKYETYLNFIQNKKTPPQPEPIVKQKPEQETPKTFEELFYNTDLVTPCIDILNKLDPPLIDTDCNYIGKLKGVFCVWIDEMQRQGIVKHYSDRKIFASLIAQKIKRFSIDESMFGKHQSKAENLYRTDIKTKVSKIKLSQNSQ